MSRKSQLKRMIDDSEREIKALEQKRERSQSAIMRAIISKKTPDPTDEEYFRVFSALIDNERKNLRSMIEELENLSSQKKEDKKKAKEEKQKAKEEKKKEKDDKKDDKK